MTREELRMFEEIVAALRHATGEVDHSCDYPEEPLDKRSVDDEPCPACHGERALDKADEYLGRLYERRSAR